MEIATNCLPDASSKSARRRSKRTTRPQLLTRSSLDGRTNAAKLFDRLVADIEADLAGRDQLSAIERALVEAFAGAYVSLSHLNTKLALGEPIDLGMHAQCVGAMVRVASRLGLQRRCKGCLADTLGLFANVVTMNLDACVDEGVTERPPVESLPHVAFVVHPSQSGNLLAMAITHYADDKFILDLIREDISIADAAGVLKRYGISRVTGAESDGDLDLAHAVSGVFSVLRRRGMQ
jgi:hypothetical protein